MKRSHIKLCAAMALAATMFSDPAPAMAIGDMSLKETRAEYTAQIQDDMIVVKALGLSSPAYDGPFKTEMGSMDRLDIPGEYIPVIAALSSLPYFSEDMIEFFIKENAGSYKFMSGRITKMVLDLVAEPIGEDGKWFKVLPNVGLTALEVSRKNKNDIEPSFEKIVDAFYGYAEGKGESLKQTNISKESDRFAELAQLYALKALGVKILNDGLFKRCVEAKLLTVDEMENILTKLNNTITYVREPLAQKIEQKIETHQLIKQMRSDIDVADSDYDPSMGMSL